MGKTTEPSRIGSLWGKVHHWTHDRKGTRILHPGVESKCKRVHYDEKGKK